MSRLISKILIAFFLFAGISAAHAPFSVDLKFDKKTQLLTVTFLHQVRDVNKHYVKTVKIKHNKEDVIEQMLSQQDDSKHGSLVFKLNNVKPGDTIAAQLTCSMGGVKNGEFKIE